MLVLYFKVTCTLVLAVSVQAGESWRLMAVSDFSNKTLAELIILGGMGVCGLSVSVKSERSHQVSSSLSLSRFSPSAG